MTSNVEHEFFKTSEHSSQVTRLQGFEGYMVTELQNPPYILPYLAGCISVIQIARSISRE